MKRKRRSELRDGSPDGSPRRLGPILLALKMEEGDHKPRWGRF